MKFKIGDTVSFLNEKGRGVITGFLKDDTALVSVEDGFEIPYPVAQLVLFVNPLNTEAGENQKLNEKLIRQKINFNDTPKKSKKHTCEYWEVDLHIGELVDSYKHLSNFQMLEIQLNHCRKMLERAKAAKIKKLYIIHGVGNGVLKHEIIKYLQAQQGIIFYDAPYRMFGIGATEVNII